MDRIALDTRLAKRAQAGIDIAAASGLIVTGFHALSIMQSLCKVIRTKLEVT